MTNLNDDGPRLLVPIDVAAMMVNQPLLNEGTWDRWQMDYTRLSAFDSPMPGPFESEVVKPDKPGVYLHWALPDALTHGKQDEQSKEMLFKYAPNRWLVARMSAGQPARAWVVQSDIPAPNSDQASPFMVPTAQDPTVYQPSRIGVNTPLEAWRGETQTNSPPFFLQAIGPGDVTFAAFEPGVRNVFAFYDDVSTLPAASLSYLVAGWYSDARIDPLASAGASTWQDLLAELDWRVLGDTSRLPQRSLLHGMLYDVKWQTETLPDRPNFDTLAVSQNVKVAAGNTAIDALAALIAWEANKQGGVPGLDRLMEAFQYHLLDTLDQPGGAAELDARIRQAWFGALPGGTVWQIVTPERAQTTATGAPQTAPTITAPQKEWLAELNSQQRQLDAARRELAAMQWELYALWWKNGKAPHFADPQGVDDFEALKADIRRALDATQQGSFVGQVIAQIDHVRRLAAPLPDPNDANSISAYAQGTLTDGLVLKPATMPRFWHPNDPVVLIAGLSRAQRHGEGGTLICRMPDQTVARITVNGVTIAAAKLAGVIPVVANAYIPTEIAALVVEAFLLDPANAALIAQHGLNAADDGAIQAVSKVQNTLIAALPSDLIAVAWAQAWAPLYLDWMVDWYHTDHQADDGTWLLDTKNWQFDGQEYVWSGGAATNGQPLSYSGRTFLTPQAIYGFGDRLQQYLNGHPNPDLQAAETLLGHVMEWDLLSQTLSGFTSHLAMRRLEINLPPDRSVAGQIGDHYQGVPDVDIGNIDTDFGAGYPFFFPVRGGFFRFKQLRILDTFGQTLDLLFANGNPSGNVDSFYPLRGRGLTPDAQSRLPTPDLMLELPPRLVQSSRLNVRLVSAGDDAAEVGLVATATPVCGWLIPNHLDGGLAFYDAQGLALGELLLRGSGAQATVDWQIAPNSPAGVASPDQIGNAHLRQIATELWSLSDAGPVFQNFLQVVDETLWRVNPLGARGDQNMAVLIGRPLAVVRARLQLEVYGHPFYNQSWGATFARDDGGLGKLAFPVALGNLELPDDGLIGYYLDTQPRQFNAVHIPDDLLPANPPYIAQIGQNQNYINLQSDSAQLVTMLLDPRGNVHAASGILPAKVVELPAEYFEQALATMALTFRVGPLLIDPGVVAIPRPAEQNGAWAWVQRKPGGKGDTDWEEDPISAADQAAHLSDALLSIRDGWLKFTPDSKGL
jgi:hypothetical protein